ncbi:sulfotransferase family 2 domain-containing protein [Sinorhizobium meliloti]|uniref:sulfotransferase family 2 domain-containing protein n=1 Tax=Rhizobium meliloti TaxID=382 RepID=UPI000FDCBFE8|nr:sulfotransferase family 2 domain-containing protein [Sinorhizobium meliloti]RVE81806.1 hypothetical protein CN238_29245 [Sinorhizobium meliloti]RVH18321.1 hypothetical protein CN214_34335 [Sinorhizobium meliloti]
MGISLQKQFIYFVVPKTGSATLRKALSQYIDIKRPTEHFSEHVPIKRFLASSHADLTRDFFKFSFVRNPYDRLYSGFRQDVLAAYKLKHWEESKKPIFDRIGEDFNRYVIEYVTRADIRNDPFWICFCPMHEFTHLNGRLFVDFVGKTETLWDDIRKLEKILKLECAETEDLNVRNPSRSELKYIEHYSPEVIEIVNGLYSDDFRYFGYTPLEPSAFHARS